MGIMQHRARAAARVPEGGGLVATSLTDTATDQDVLESYTGEGPAGLLGDVNLDYDDLYGNQTSGHDGPNTDPYTTHEAGQDLADFADRPYGHSQPGRDVAQTWGSGTLGFDSTADAILIAGADPKRKRIVIKNISYPDAKLQCDVNIGGDASVPKRLGSSGHLLRGGNALLGLFGDQMELTSTGEVWVVQCVDPSVAPLSVTVTWFSESYA
jgi:hypothetical protein